jgi:hypothetical protein
MSLRLILILAPHLAPQAASSKSQSRCEYCVILIGFDVFGLAYWAYLIGFNVVVDNLEIIVALWESYEQRGRKERLK